MNRRYIERGFNMKKKFNFSVFYTILLAATLSACSDDTSSAPEEPVDNFNAAEVCPENLRGTFTDARDGQIYKYTTIANQVWMAENLKFDAPYSVCYEKIEGFCDTFGRFYSLHEGGKPGGLFDQELLDTICPAGWRIPSVDDWIILIKNMGGEKKAISRLYSSDDFGENFMKSSDDCGFNSLPAGIWLSSGSLASEYVVSAYWTSTAMNAQSAYSSLFNYNGITFGMNEPKMTIRCIKN